MALNWKSFAKVIQLCTTKKFVIWEIQIWKQLNSWSTKIAPTNPDPEEQLLSCPVEPNTTSMFCLRSKFSRGSPGAAWTLIKVIAGFWMIKSLRLAGVRERKKNITLRLTGKLSLTTQQAETTLATNPNSFTDWLPDCVRYSNGSCSDQHLVARCVDPKPQRQNSPRFL